MDPANPEVLMRLFNWFKSETTPTSTQADLKTAAWYESGTPGRRRSVCADGGSCEGRFTQV